MEQGVQVVAVERGTNLKNEHTGGIQYNNQNRRETKVNRIIIQFVSNSIMNNIKKSIIIQ